MEFRSLLDHYNANEYNYSTRVFAIGLINDIGIGIFIAYVSNLCYVKNQQFQFAAFTIFLQLVNALGRFFNAH